MAMQQKFGPNGWTPERLSSLKGKTFVITGATAGAGFEATRVLLSKGAKVVMMNRNADKSAAAIARLKQELGTDAQVTFVQMDLAVLDSVREAAAKIMARVHRIDALICNAAIAQVARQEITVDGFESQLGVNHFGHFLLCGLLFERIEASGGRIVVVGSNAYKMGLKRIQFEDLNFDKKYTPWNAYAQSKLAQMMFAYELQRRVEAAGKRTRVLVCHPGAARTNLLKDTAGPLQKALWAVLSLLAQSAEKGAWPEVMCATEEGLEPAKLYGPTRFEMVGPVGECPLEELALNREMAAKLWTLSEQKTSLRWAL
ncbi:SDR family oxidoreductase [Microbulbifer thermotolerans]|uniref:Oxidoreductase n=1 Tax=Microbulbifer thermotolerans TaxID=252514 RepID=A0A143HQP4_MICTH|nr:SDR family oxidoreductase [Microbulbifer thermotolerans]AMX03811.1 oxidoreductase [Microbulbifer thermotolerans]MCX2778695.1 SDR family oxidoreductase [Microbulbifer thermotolerans]MCX2783755.1 SDR family oxidoreductase [Microbulbifer thermotolerans]MCX2803796.1 SDR family oxidoreductase [Microbulbifer thermotolerans]